MPNQIVWCDIPVKDLDRATKFYGAVLGAKLEKQSCGGAAITLLPGVQEGVSGCLTPSEGNPSVDGPLIYLNCDGRMPQAISSVGLHGGKVLQSRHAIGQHGFRAVILDTEGNRVALHSST